MTDSDPGTQQQGQVRAQQPTLLASHLRTLRAMSDGFLTVDSDWKITFANDAAQRLLSDGRCLVGTVLWEAAASQVPSLEPQCRRTRAEGRPTGFELRRPGDQRLYHVRLTPAPGDGLAVSFAEVTHERARDG